MTLLPYYTAFQPPAMRTHARDALRCGNTDGLLVRLGMAAFRAGRITRLRFCHLCLAEMRVRHGEYYWRRVHQLPSVLVCPDHCCLLQQSTVDLAGHSRHAFVHASRENCPWHARPLLRDLATTERAVLVRLAKSSAALLLDPGLAQSFRDWTSWYRRKMLGAGLAVSPTRMKQAELAARMRNHLVECLSALPDVMDGDRFAGDWLAAMVRKHRKATHPLYHLLLQDLLQHCDAHASPFGQSPWACRNPLAEHRNQDVVTGFEQHRNHGHAVGVFSCTCGYVYTRSFHEQTQTLGPPRFLRYGPLLKPALQKAIRSGCSLREIARRLDIDPKTVVRLANDLGLANPWKAYPRERRLEATVASKGVVTDVHERQRDELQRRNMRDRGPRLNWGAMDIALSEQVRQASLKIRDRLPPVRVTVAEIERDVAKRCWFAKRSNKLPRTLACLKAETESIEDFQQRRVGFVLGEFCNQEVPLVPWRVMRVAGLTVRHLPMIAARIAVWNQPRRAAA